MYLIKQVIGTLCTCISKLPGYGNNTDMHMWYVIASRQSGEVTFLLFFSAMRNVISGWGIIII